MRAFGSIILTRFPFTNLSGDKRCPALVVSCDNQRRFDLVVCFITFVLRAGLDMAPIAPTVGTGLKTPSVLLFEKLATLDLAVIVGKLGDTPADWLDMHSSTFFGVFGFRSS